jgi:hypothetical protein
MAGSARPTLSRKPMRKGFTTEGGMRFAFPPYALYFYLYGKLRIFPPPDPGGSPGPVSPLFSGGHRGSGVGRGAGPGAGRAGWYPTRSFAIIPGGRLDYAAA